MCSAGALRSAVPSASARMAAWRAHAYSASGVGELRLDEARVPVLRAPDELLVRVHQASLNPLDLYMLEGYGRRALGALRRWEGLTAGEGGGQTEALPLTPGRDFCGEVVRAGPAAAASARPGAAVWGVVPPHRVGAHAQYVVVKQKWTSPVPARLAGGAGGALYAGLSALALLRAGGVAEAARDARVLLLGLGGVGQMALQVLVAAGASVVVSCSRDCAERALSLGAAAALDRRAAAAEWAAAAAARGPYVAVLDAAGLGGRGAAALPAAARAPRYATLTSPALRYTDARGLPAGLAASALELARQNAGACAAAGAALSAGGARGGGAPPTVTWAYFTPSAAGIERLRRLAERGQLVVPVEAVYEWWRGAEAYARAARGGARGKLLLDFTASPPATPAAPPAAPAAPPAAPAAPPPAPAAPPADAATHTLQ